MNQKIYKEIYVIIYYLILRIALYRGINLDFFNIGLLYDLCLIVFILFVIQLLFKKTFIRNSAYLFLLLFIFGLTVGNIWFTSFFEVLLSATNIHAVKWVKTENNGDYNLTIPSIYIPLMISYVVFAFLIVTTKCSLKVNARRLMISSLVLLLNVIFAIAFHFIPEETSIEYYQSNDYLYESDYNKQKFTEKWGFLNYHIIDLVRYNRDDIVSNEEAIDQYFDEKELHQDNVYSDLYKDYNLITVLSETLDTRFIDETLTPTLYKMKEEGMVFDNYYTTVFQNGATCNSEFMSLTGLNAVNADQLSINACDAYNENSFPYTLPNQLKELGYESYYFHGLYPNLYDRFNTIPGYGFDQFYFQKDIIGSYPSFDGHLDSHLVYFMDEYLDYEEPFYANILSYSMHGAYNNSLFEIHSDQVLRAHPEEDNPEIINYMEKLVEFDIMLEEILNRLDENGVLDTTLIAIFPDHYPYMMDHDFYMDYWDVDKYELKRQDLILYTPNMTPSVQHATGSTEDITPSLLNLLYKDADFAYFTGNDLFSLGDKYVLFHDNTVTDGENYLTLDGEYTGNLDRKSLLQEQLVEEIHQYEISRKILHIDYFNLQ